MPFFACLSVMFAFIIHLARQIWDKNKSNKNKNYTFANYRNYFNNFICSI
jgi:hypothetical protein